MAEKACRFARAAQILCLTFASVGKRVVGNRRRLWRSAGSGCRSLRRAALCRRNRSPRRRPLPHVAAALKLSRKLNILIIGSPVGVGRGPRKSYPLALESLLERAIAGVDVVILNRPVSGETIATSAERMRTEVALARPDLLIWQVGANDALARVPPGSYEESLREGVRWARDNGVDVLLVGFEANPWLHDDQEVLAVREATSRVARQENVLYLRRYEAMQFLARTRSRIEQGDEAFPADIGYDCMAEQVAQALAANMVLRRTRPAPVEP